MFLNLKKLRIKLELYLLNRKHEMFLNNYLIIKINILISLNRKHEMFLNICYKNWYRYYITLNRKHEMFLNCTIT